MSSMFYDCSNLTEFDFSKVDTSNVTDMSSMFSGCSNLTKLGFSTINTSNVTDMRVMFQGCSSLANLDLSTIDTGSVTDMRGMFSGCSSLTNLDLSILNTSNVTEMSYMFSRCSNLTGLDLGTINTSNVTDMSDMFMSCSSLTELDLSKLDLSNVTDMGNMFYGCSSLTELDLSKLDLSNVTDMSDTLNGCSSLTELNFSSLDLGSVTTMSSMFSGCSGLKSINFSNTDLSSLTGEPGFSNCSSLTGIDFSSANLHSVTKLSFSGCNSVTSIDFSNADLSSATYIDFDGCGIIENINFSNADLRSATRIDLSDCSSVTNIDFSNANLCNIDMRSMFYNCSSLKSLDLAFDEDNISYRTPSLTNCKALTAIYTPRSNKGDIVSVSLPGNNWYDMSGKKYSSSFNESQEASLLLYSGEKPEIAKAYIKIGTTKKTYACGEALGGDDIFVLYYGTDGTAKKLASGEYTVNVDDLDMNTAGRKTLTVSCKDSDGETYTAEATLWVKSEKPVPPEKKTLGEDNVTITLPDSDAYDYVYNGKEKRPLPTVVYHGDGADITLTQGKDYTFDYMENVVIYGNPRVRIIGCGDYTGIVEKPFEIKRAAAPVLEDIVRRYNAGIVNSTDGDYAEYTIDIGKCLNVYGFVDEIRAAGSPIEDNTIPGNVLADTPVYDSSGFSYKVSAKAAAGDFVTIPIEVVFGNYENAVLNVKIMLRDKPVKQKKATISGIEISDSIYNKAPVVYTGKAKVVADNKDVTSLVNLTCTYSGTQADGSSYAASQTAPVNAGSYQLTVTADSAEYAGSASYRFKITPAPLTITARDMGVKIGAPLPKQEDYLYDAAGLLTGDTLTTAPTLSCNITDTTKAGTYDIIASNADAGMNYEISYKSGTLTVSETGESTKYYTVTYNMNGHGTDITNTGVKEGSFLEKPQNPQAAGYTFTGWYKDQSCTVPWNFEKDTVTSDTTLYAGWKKEGSGGNNNTGDDMDKDDSPYEDSERTDLNAINAAIADIKAKVYDGDAYKPVVKVTATIDKKKVTLTEGADYRVLYQNNINAGTGTVLVRGNGEYKGELTQTFTITQKPVKKLKILTGSIAGAATKQAASDAVYVYDGAKRLVEGTDYELSEPQPVKNKTDVVQITITGKEAGNYGGQSAAKKINVYEAGTQLITPECVTLDKTSVPYTGKAINDIKVTVTVGGSTLDPKKDYKVQYQNNKDAGTAYITVTGKGKTYKGAVVVPFTITPETIAKPNDFAIKEIKKATFNGKLQKPAVSVSIQKNGKAKKLSKKDYTVAYKDNFHAGTATVIVTGKGNYAGLSAETTFTIAPQQIKKASLKGTQGALTLTYSKRKLKEGTDYETPTYGTPDKNKVEVTITGKGDFTGELRKKIKVSGK